MYGTIAILKVKPGKEADLMAHGQAEDALKIAGHIGEFIYRMDADPAVFYMAVIFDSKESYVANANSPGQNDRYEKMLALLERAPEWHDGEIVHSHPKVS